MLRCGGIDGMIGPYEYIRYEDPADVFRAYDDRYPVVARSIADLIGARAPDVRVEHIGSTAVPGCDGNGVVDMMLLYAPGGIGPARDTLDALGFQRQLGGPHAFSEERPVRVGVTPARSRDIPASYPCRRGECSRRGRATQLPRPAVCRLRAAGSLRCA